MIYKTPHFQNTIRFRVGFTTMILILAPFCLGQNHSQEKPSWLIGFESFETERTHGLTIEFQASSFEDSHNVSFKPEVQFGPTSEGFTGWRLKKAPRISYNKKAGHETDFSIQLDYHSSRLPFTYQRFKVGLRNSKTGRLDSTYVYVYFTPYGTVEVWNQDDFEALNRVWASPHGPQGKRREFSRELVPEQAFEFKTHNGETVPTKKLSVPGLAYTVPVPAPVQEPGPRKTSFIGTVSGFVNTTVEDEYQNPFSLSIAGIRVEVWETSGLFGDQLITTGYTDESGVFSIDFDYTAGNNNNSINVYVTVVATTADEMIRVRKRGGAIRSSDHFRSTPAVFTLNNPATHNFGFATVDNHDVKPQLLHWTRRSRQFVEENAPGVLPSVSSDRLDIMRPFVPFAADSAYFFPGGYTWDIIFVSALVFGSFSPVALVLVGGATLLFVSNNDCLYIGQDRQLSENVAYHEFGHYLMWHLQNESWVDAVEASFAFHTLSENNPNPKLSWTEGFAHGFGAMVDTWARTDDGEFGLTRGGDYEECDVVPNGGGNLIPLENVGTVTHGFVSEWSIACLLYDLWDGPANPNREGTAFTTAGDYDDGGWDDVNVSFQQIIEPIQNNGGTGGMHMGPIFFPFNNDQEQFLITDVVQYHEELMQATQLDHSLQGAITQLFHDGLVSNFQSTSFVNLDQVSGDSLSFVRPVTTNTYDNNGLLNGTTTNFFTVDVTLLQDSDDRFQLNNFAPNGLNAVLIDDLEVSGTAVNDFATLVFNGAGSHGWQNVNNSYGAMVTPGLPAVTRLNLDLDGDMNLRVHESGKLKIGAGPNKTATVTLKSGSTLILGGDDTGNVLSEETTYFTYVSMGFLEINAGSRFVVEEGATLIFNRGGNIILNGGGELEIRGNLVVAPMADFDPMGDGKVIFGLPDNGGNPNIDIGTDSVISLIELDLELLPYTYFMPDWEVTSRLRIQHCYVLMGNDTYWDTASSEFKLTDSNVFPSGVDHQGFWVRDVLNWFEDNLIAGGSPCIYGIDQVGIGNTTLMVIRNEFHESDTGILVENRPLVCNGGFMRAIADAGINATGGFLNIVNMAFRDYEIAILAGNSSGYFEGVYMSEGETGLHLSNPIGSLTWIGGNSVENEDYGVHVLGGSNSISLQNVALNRNGTGMRVSGPSTVYLPCSQAIDNEMYGLEMNDGARLDIGNYAYFQAQGNQVNIQLNQAARPILDLGNNYLTANGLEMNIVGTLSDPTCAANPVILANENDVIHNGGSQGFDVREFSGGCTYSLTTSMPFYSCAYPAP